MTWVQSRDKGLKDYCIKDSVISKPLFHPDSFLTHGSIVRITSPKVDHEFAPRNSYNEGKLVKCEKGHEPSTTDGFAVSRRHMMKYLTAEVLGLTLLPKPAEARMSRLEMKKKMMKKLEELREKAGVSKPKTENNGMKKSAILPLPLPAPRRQSWSIGGSKG
ncbi:hypothetical protein V6Z11_D01G178600 [Gossypium hirsutum]